MALLAVALIAVALLISWYAPGPPSSETNLLVMQKSGIILCGTLQKDKTGSLVLIRNGQKPEPLKNIASMYIVSSCP